MSVIGDKIPFARKPEAHILPVSAQLVRVDKNEHGEFPILPKQTSLPDYNLLAQACPGVDKYTGEVIFAIWYTNGKVDPISYENSEDLCRVRMSRGEGIPHGIPTGMTMKQICERGNRIFPDDQTSAYLPDLYVFHQSQKFNYPVLGKLPTSIDEYLALCKAAPRPKNNQTIHTSGAHTHFSHASNITPDSFSPMPHPSTAPPAPAEDEIKKKRRRRKADDLGDDPKPRSRAKGKGKGAGAKAVEEEKKDVEAVDAPAVKPAAPKTARVKGANKPRSVKTLPGPPLAARVKTVGSPPHKKSEEGEVANSSSSEPSSSEGGDAPEVVVAPPPVVAKPKAVARHTKAKGAALQKLIQQHSTEVPPKPVEDKMEEDKPEKENEEEEAPTKKRKSSGKASGPKRKKVVEDDGTYTINKLLAEFKDVMETRLAKIPANAQHFIAANPHEALTEKVHHLDESAEDDALVNAILIYMAIKEFDVQQVPNVDPFLAIYKQNPITIKAYAHYATMHKKDFDTFDLFVTKGIAFRTDNSNRIHLYFPTILNPLATIMHAPTPADRIARINDQINKVKDPDARWRLANWFITLTKGELPKPAPPVTETY